MFLPKFVLTIVGYNTDPTYILGEIEDTIADENENRCIGHADHRKRESYIGIP